MVGVLISPIAPETGLAFVEQAEPVAIAWDKMARQNPRVKSILDRMLTGGGWTGVLMAYSGIGAMAVKESGLLAKVPYLKRFFSQSKMDDERQSTTDDFGNPLPPVTNIPPFERRPVA
jgi:hypothetical protein